MPTVLTRPLRREIVIAGEPYTVTLSARGIRLARKRFRSGPEWRWEELLAQAPSLAHGSTGAEEAPDR
jgi:hypothetical protein